MLTTNFKKYEEKKNASDLKFSGLCDSNTFIWL